MPPVAVGVTAHNQGVCVDGYEIARKLSEELGGPVSFTPLRKGAIMPEQDIDPKACKQRARELVADYINTRYGERKSYDVYVTAFTSVGKTWKATLTTTLPHSAIFTVEYYALKQETTLRVYAHVETVTKYSREN